MTSRNGGRHRVARETDPDARGVGVATGTAQRLSRVHRIGTAAFALGLATFGVLGLVDQLAFLSTTGKQVLGMSSNGLLSTISLVVAAVLLGAAARGGRSASTATAVIGVLFLLSGLGNLAVLNTALNLLAFELSNVLFSLVAGILLLTLGSYGRFTAGLGADNPYYQERHHDDPQPAGPAFPPSAAEAALDAELAQAERALAERAATPEQVKHLQWADRYRAQEDRRRAWANYRATDEEQVTGT